MHLVSLHAAVIAAALAWPAAASAAPATQSPPLSTGIPTPLPLPSATPSPSPLPTATASPAAVTLHSMVEQAWQRSSAGRSLPARQAEVAASGDLAGSWLATAPVLGLGQRSDRWTDQRGQRESDISLSATVALPAQVAARRALAGAAAAQLRAQVAKSRLDIAGEVRTALWDAAEAEVVVDEKRSHLHHMGELADDVQRRVAAGDMARTDALLATQEVHLARIDLARAQAQAAVLLAKWRVLTGEPTLPLLEPEPLPSAATATGADTRVAAARASAQLAQSALRLSEAHRRPAPVLALSLRRERDDVLARPENSAGIAIQIPLGSAGRNRPAEALAQAQLAVAAADAARAESSAAADIDTARIQLDNARVALQAASARALDMREYAQLIDKAFRLGERGLAEALRALVIEHEAAMAERQQRVALSRAHALLNQAFGVVP